MSSTHITLYSGPLSMFGAKAQIAALEKGIDVDLVMVPFDFHTLYAPKHPDVLRINPKGQVPVLVHGDLELFDSTQIFEYFEDLKPAPPLWPHDVRDRARARMLEMQSDEVYFPQVVRLMGLQEKLAEDAALSAIAAARAFYGRMDLLLADKRDWLLGAFTYADIGFYMAALFGERQGATLTSATPMLLAWRDRMSQRESVRQVAGTMAKWLLSAGRPLPVFMQEMSG
ncbi:MAG: glutathione S-transferase family protein [Pseudomonadota bacterium]